MKLDVTAVGDNLNYTWNLGTSTIDSLVITNLNTTDQGNYEVVINGDCGTVISSTTPVTVVAATTTSQPSLVDTNLCPGEDLTLTVGAIGNNLTYQWTKDDSNLTVETRAQISANSINASDAGTYSVNVIGDCRNETSTNTTILVSPTTIIVEQPTDTVVCAQSTTCFDVVATGENLNYLW